MSEDLDLQKVLEDRLIAFQSDGEPEIAFINVNFEPPDNNVWLKYNIVPRKPTAVTIGENGYDEHSFLMEIGIFGPAWSEGRGQVDAVVDALLDHFREEKNLTEDSVTITITAVWPTAHMISDKYHGRGISVEGIFYRQR